LGSQDPFGPSFEQAHGAQGVAAPQKGEEVTFVDVTLWARLAEIAQPFPGPNGAPLGLSSPAQRSAATQRWQESDIIQPITPEKIRARPASRRWP
jgi:hypothetical protein